MVFFLYGVMKRVLTSRCTTHEAFNLCFTRVFVSVASWLLLFCVDPLCSLELAEGSLRSKSQWLAVR